MQIEYYIKNKYGTDCRIVKDKYLRIAVKNITGQETLTLKRITGFHKLGITFKHVILEDKEL